ncbi:hypothetical protein BD779DRAFT_196787 [Infundibulicybe gibba]|nr:hypothetical protein BD779DRAFT_196787 [Infundibulicybe gibba]
MSMFSTSNQTLLQREQPLNPLGCIANNNSCGDPAATNQARVGGWIYREHRSNTRDMVRACYLGQCASSCAESSFSVSGRGYTSGRTLSHMRLVLDQLVLWRKIRWLRIILRRAIRQPFYRHIIIGPPTCEPRDNIQGRILHHLAIKTLQILSSVVLICVVRRICAWRGGIW